MEKKVTGGSEFSDDEGLDSPSTLLAESGFTEFSFEGENGAVGAVPWVPSAGFSCVGYMMLMMLLHRTSTLSSVLIASVVTGAEVLDIAGVGLFVFDGWEAELPLFPLIVPF